MTRAQARPPLERALVANTDASRRRVLRSYARQLGYRSAAGARAVLDLLEEGGLMVVEGADTWTIHQDGSGTVRMSDRRRR